MIDFVQLTDHEAVLLSGRGGGNKNSRDSSNNLKPEKEKPDKESRQRSKTD